MCCTVVPNRWKITHAYLQSRASKRLSLSSPSLDSRRFELKIALFFQGRGVFTFINDAEGEKYFALASSTLFSAACGLTISKP